MYVFDFDGTLFGSPPPKDQSKSGRWYASVMSLSPPVVPEVPDSSWWNAKVLPAAKAAIADPNAIAILLTGRDNTPDFSYRIAELLKSAGLNFDAIHLKHTKGDTGDFKLDIMRRYIKKFDVTEVEIWDDVPELLNRYETDLTSDGVTVKANLVPEYQKQAERGASHAVYTGLFLDEQSHKALLEWWGQDTIRPELFPDIKAHHVTFQFDPDGDHLLELPVGQEASVQVTGWAADKKAQAVSVELPAELAAIAKKGSHVTVAIPKGGSAVSSNALMNKINSVTDGPVLHGRVGYNDGKQDLFEARKIRHSLETRKHR